MNANKHASTHTSIIHRTRKSPSLTETTSLFGAVSHLHHQVTIFQYSEKIPSLENAHLPKEKEVHDKKRKERDIDHDAPVSNTTDNVLAMIVRDIKKTHFTSAEETNYGLHIHRNDDDSDLSTASDLTAWSAFGGERDMMHANKLAPLIKMSENLPAAVSLDSYPLSRTEVGQIQRKERPLLVVFLLFAVAVAALGVFFATTSWNHHSALGKPLLYLSAVPTVAPSNKQSTRLKDSDAVSENPPSIASSANMLTDAVAVSEKSLSIMWSGNLLTHEATTFPTKKSKLEDSNHSNAASYPNSVALPWSMATAVEWNPANWLVVDDDKTETQTAARPEPKKRFSSARNELVQLGRQLKRGRSWLRRAFGKKQ